MECNEVLNHAEKIKVETHHIQAQGIISSYAPCVSCSWQGKELGSNQLSVDSVKSAIQCAQRALELADEDARTDSPTPRDYVRAYWLLGSAYRTNNELTLAEENLSKALNLCRQINLVEMEADILLDLARFILRLRTIVLRSGTGSNISKTRRKRRPRR